MLNRIKIILQYLLPKRWLTKLVGWSAERRCGWLTYGAIKLFIYWYKINMQEVKQPDISAYPTFNAFFIRLLSNKARPIDFDPNVIVLPVDGMISQFGIIKGNQVFQAKGHHYSLEALLAGYKSMANLFYDGTFVTIYLSPRDYHRVHMPCNGILREMLYVPGKLFSVNQFMVENIPNLFALNERIICLFDTDFGPMVQILVGATIVSSIETVWTETLTLPKNGVINRWQYPKANTDGALILLKGQEMGYFKLGSTVINLFAKKKILLDRYLYTKCITRVGQRLACGIMKNNRLLI
ncbi:Phosphatidylserine decarboxylase proenzyme [Candidatus Gullanella endobia]|uniref:Phosphatidylserine decarboxylase proenzyme n=1 Tax=Candidatus Gullanella endobia TaxID=1070130 RepID=A0A143WTG1_9ENTR|nr:archaetidylserine decarboxylase [Candidatus Gullanella endobia]CUX96139.1 Phosphatidylserine decarboxylase proenzyme [Candidatus Gullanella endobia]